MSKTSRIVRYFFTLVIVAACAPLSVEGEETRTPTVCEERDLQQAIQPITTTVRDGKLYEILLGNEVYAGRLALSHDGSKLAIPIYRGPNWERDGVYVFDTNNGQLTCILPIKSNGAIFEGIAFSPNDLYSASLFLDGTVLLRDSSTGEIIRELKTIEHESPGWINFNSDGSRIVTSGYQQPARVWETDTGRLIISVDSTRVALSPDGDSLAIPDSDGIKIINIATQKVETVIEYGGEAKVNFLFSTDGDYLYLLNSFSEVTVWNSHNGEMTNKLNPSIDYEEFGWEKQIRLSLSSDGSRLLMENSSKIIVWDTNSWEELVNGHSIDLEKLVPIFDAVITPSGEFAVVNYAYNIIRFWNLSQ